MSTSQKSGMPGSRWIFILSLFSIAGCWVFGVVGLLVGIYSFSLARKALDIHLHGDYQYRDKSLKLIKASRIYSVVGISLSSIYILMLFIKIIA